MTQSNQFFALPISNPPRYRDRGRIYLKSISGYVGLSQITTLVNFSTNEARLVGEMILGAEENCEPRLLVKTHLEVIHRDEEGYWGMCFSFSANTGPTTNLELNRLTKIAERLSEFAELKLIKQ